MNKMIGEKNQSTSHMSKRKKEENKKKKKKKRE
jgi:hypothetical protein